MPLYLGPLREGCSAQPVYSHQHGCHVVLNPLPTGASEHVAQLTNLLSEDDFTPGEWLAVVEAVERAAAGQPRFIVTSSHWPTARRTDP